jgi:membrane peptidoglycan carboxypeptidase
MPDTQRSGTSLLSAVAGTLGFSVLAGALVTVMVAPAIAVTGVTANQAVGIFNELPEYIQLDPGSTQNTISVVDPGTGAMTDVATIYKQNREEVPLDRISDYLECAAIAGEDRRFYEHGGVDMPSLVRATLGQITGNDEAGGASTLSMQLVRNILQQQAINDDSLTEEQRLEAIRAATVTSIDRKIAEMKLAIGLEKNYSKEEILQGYLNIAGFGGNTYGVQAAAKEFFGKTAADVTIAEAASLIAIVQYPNQRSLNNAENYPRNQDRRDVILREMAGYGCISAEERDAALATPVEAGFVNPQAATVGCRNAQPAIYGFACDYAVRVVHELEALGGSEAERLENWDRGGYRLVLTLDPRVQGAAYDTVNRWAPAGETRFQLGAAAVSVQTGTGRIVSMAQNKTFDNDPTVTETDTTRTALNYAVDRAHGGSIGFQPGSTYKPYVLLAFLAAGRGVNESFDAGIREVNQADFLDTCPAQYNAQGELQGPPWGGRYDYRNDSGEAGMWSVVRGTGASVNSVFIQMARAVDQCSIRTLAESIGVHNGDGETPLFTRPSCSLGGCENNIAPLQQAAAYAAIANQGVYCAPIMIDQVFSLEDTALANPLGGQVHECGQSQVSPDVANTAAYAMESTMRATGSASRPSDGTPYIGKTGTTNGSVHTWMVGSSTNISTAVWVGNVQGEQALRNIRVEGVQAGQLRHRIFKPIAETINSFYGGNAFPGPAQALLSGTPVIVPDVLGNTIEQAQSAITLNELTFADGGQEDSDLPVGTVTRTDPAAGSSVTRGATVTVYTSNGLAKQIPDVTNQQRNAAKSQIEALGFTVTEQCVDDGDLPTPPPTTPPTPNSVLSQDPAGGTFRNPANTTVTLRYYGGANC